VFYDETMEFNYYRPHDLSSKALDLIQFDADSIHQLAAAERCVNPDIWLVDPDEYEKNGRIRRDSESPRMLAYSSESRVLYATDGSNSCTSRLPANLETLSPGELKLFAEQNDLRPELLERLAMLVPRGER